MIEKVANLKALTLLQLADLKLAKPETIIGPFFQGSLSMLVAPRGCGKSWLAASIGLAACSGQPLLNWECGQAAKVLFVDGEMPLYAMRERLDLIQGMFAQPSSENFFLLSHESQEFGLPDLATKPGQKALDKVIQDTGANLIILDNLSCLVRSGVENEGESWLPIMQWALRHRASQRTILFLHHAGKNGNQRGTSRKEDILDTVIQLKPLIGNSDRGAAFELSYSKARHLYGPELKPLEVRLENDLFGKLAWTKKSQEVSNFERVVDLANEGVPVKDIVAETGLGKSIVYRYIEKAKEQSLIPH